MDNRGPTVCVYIYFYPSVWADQRKKQDNIVVIPWVITKLLPSRQIVHSILQVVYLAHANMHTNHLLVAAIGKTQNYGIPPRNYRRAF